MQSFMTTKNKKAFSQHEFVFLIASKLARSDPTSSIVVPTLLKNCILRLYLTYNDVSEIYLIKCK